MTKEQEEAIERIKYLLFIYKRDDGKGYRASGDVFDTDFEAIDIFFNMLKEKDAEIEKKDKRIQELEEERDHWHGCFIVAMENSIAKEKVIDVIQEYKDKVEQYNEYKEQGKETDVEYYENIANTIVIQVLQELLEGEK